MHFSVFAAEIDKTGDKVSSCKTIPVYEMNRLWGRRTELKENSFVKIADAPFVCPDKHLRDRAEFSPGSGNGQESTEPSQHESILDVSVLPTPNFSERNAHGLLRLGGMLSW